MKEETTQRLEELLERSAGLISIAVARQVSFFSSLSEEDKIRWREATETVSEIKRILYASELERAQEEIARLRAENEILKSKASPGVILGIDAYLPVSSVPILGVSPVVQAPVDAPPVKGKRGRGNSKITEEQRREIRALVDGKDNSWQVADAYGISSSYVRRLWWIESHFRKSGIEIRT
jgi:hypothetical protein